MSTPINLVNLARQKATSLRPGPLMTDTQGTILANLLDDLADALEAKDAEIAKLTWERDHAIENEDRERTEHDELRAEHLREIASLKADKDVIRSQERNGSYERDIDALEAEIASLKEDARASSVLAAENFARAKKAEVEIVKMTRERDDFVEQIALRQPSAVERDMQEIMRINNNLRAAMEQLRPYLSPTMCKVADAALEQTATGGDYAKARR